jgi:hypothetical protein
MWHCLQTRQKLHQLRSGARRSALVATWLRVMCWHAPLSSLGLSVNPHPTLEGPPIRPRPPLAPSRHL